VTGAKSGYATVTKTSGTTLAVVAGDLTTATPTITGTAAQVGVALTAVPGTWTEGVAFAYQWLADDEEIPGATSGSFTPTASQLGAAVSVRVTGTKAGYTAESRVSPATSEIEAGVQTLQPVPTISGTPKPGSVLTASVGAWDAGSSQSIQWLVGGSEVVGATSGSYTPTIDDIGSAVTVEVTSTKAGYETVTKQSAPTAAVAPLDLPVTPTPSISGKPKVGSILSAVTAPWGAGVTLSFAWAANGTPIAGATAATLIPGADQVGKTITVSITGSKPGYTTVTKTSAPTAKVALGALAATSVPKISGTYRVGQTLTAVPGAWVAGVEFGYQWKSNGKPISGATDVTLVLTPAMLNRTITVTVTGSQPGFVSVSKTSAGKKVLVGIQTLQPRPAITGTLQIGATLSVVPETHDAGAAVTYVWYAGGAKVGTGSTLVLTSKMKGKQIWVTSTSKKAGYATVVLTSLKTPKLTATVS
jgi:hypothetical protein